MIARQYANTDDNMVELPKTDGINDQIVIDFISFAMHFVIESHDIYNVAYHIYMLMRQSGATMLVLLH